MPAGNRTRPARRTRAVARAPYDTAGPSTSRRPGRSQFPAWVAPGCAHHRSCGLVGPAASSIIISTMPATRVPHRATDFRSTAQNALCCDQSTLRSGENVTGQLDERHALLNHCHSSPDASLNGDHVMEPEGPPRRSISLNRSPARRCMRTMSAVMTLLSREGGGRVPRVPPGSFSTGIAGPALSGWS